MNQCKGNSLSGFRCSAKASEGSEYCWRHDPHDSDEDISQEEASGLFDAIVDEYFDDIKDNMDILSCKFENDQFTITGNGNIRLLRSLFHRLGFEDTNRRQSDDECAICLKSIYNFDDMVTGCSHKFHSKCLDSWVKVNQSCPLCRTKL